MLPALPDLPVRSVLPALCMSLAAGRDTVLIAPPGSGKTTLVPLALRDAAWLRERRILMLEPRRMAARAAAWRMADLLGESSGQTVGYHIRLERRESAATRILVLTEGLLTRRLMADPALADAGLVIFDEFHERSMHADLAMALCRDVQRHLRPDLRLLVMSATLEADRLARQLGDAAVLRAEGQQFPVTTRCVPRPAHEPLPRQVAGACLKALAEQTGGVLAFLPGEGEIRSVTRMIEESGAIPPDTELHPLYGALPKRAQDAALRPAPDGRRKLVLATSIAESSLTIEGIRTVVDSGWMRVARFAPATGMERLVTLRITRDRADQRRGRAGRIAPGACYRLWDETTDRQLMPCAPPEILTADLAAVVLTAADWGGAGPETLPWVTPPPHAGWMQAVSLLRDLEALDADGRITPHGRRMAHLPMHPRLAHMILKAAAAGRLAEACTVAAALSERWTPQAYGEPRSSQVETVLDIGAPSASADAAERARSATVRALARDWERATAALVRGAGHAARGDTSGTVGALLAWAYPDRIARRRGPRGDTRYLLACGRGGALRRDDPLSAHEWLVVAELDDADADAAIRLAAPIAAAEIPALFGAQLARRQELAWDGRARKVVAREIETLGAIALRERPLTDADPAALTRCLCAGLRTEGLDRLDWTPDASQLRARIAFARHVFPDEGWPDVGDAALRDTLEVWLGPHLTGRRALEDAARVNLAAALRAWLGTARAARLDRLAPTHLPVPSGSRVRIDYAAGELPVLAVRIQEVFGLQNSPRIADGRTTVLMHLLSPARRTVQVTTDLASFWRSGYAAVRKDLRARYPRHYWPENPAAAEPTRQARPRP